ncbi:hypothetical protein AK830_g238 [Neonectria ditissima]|uniref:Uncharacterized protein n=1 Tax=Neonectria ditissima TaxID=78410 RepID=A0A0P7C3D7_9HYPO|nr:hypothetical protein AK830_g238 [Neonectria ditissima]
MANFARSLKSPYLSPRLRPSMPGRSVSSSSDLSAPSNGNSPLSEDFGPDVASGRNTPTPLSSRRAPARDGFFWDAEDAGGFLSAQIRAAPLLVPDPGRPLSDDGPSRASQGSHISRSHSDLLIHALIYKLSSLPPLLTCSPESSSVDHDSPSASSSRPATPRIHSSNNNSSNPIIIELPQHRRFSAAPIRTPPEPLSARGDLPGGYFPLHEDPNSRVHRPHPFQAHHDARMARHQSMGLVPDSRPAYADRPTSNPGPGLSMAQSNTPVASFLSAGFHDSPLPMGKYYPSNYEQRADSQASLRPSLSASLASASASDSDVTLRAPDRSQIATPESEIKRKLQQYQRDMVAQASMAANELLGSSVSSSVKRGTGSSLGSIRIRDTRFTAPAPLKPMSPKLLPLGSPGPVTPMTLESGGNYLSMTRDGGREDPFGHPGGL